MRPISREPPAIRSFAGLGLDDALLLAPGVCFAISNYVQHASAMGGAGGFIHAVTGFALLLAAFSLAVAAPMTARRLREGRFARKPHLQILGHAAIVAIGAPVQFLAIAIAVTNFRDQLSVKEVISLASQSIVQCLPAWIAVYAFLVAVDSRLELARDGRRSSAGAASPPTRLCFYADGADHFFDPSAIEQVRAMGDYVQIHAGRRRLTVKATMTEIEGMLEPHGFARLHRGSIVRLTALTGIERMDTGAYEAVLSSGDRVPLSRRRLATVRAAIESVPDLDGGA